MLFDSLGTILIFKPEGLASPMPVFDGVPPDLYSLGPGDQLTVYIWGKLEQNS